MFRPWFRPWFQPWFRPWFRPLFQPLFRPFVQSFSANLLWTCLCRFVMAPGATDRGHDGLDAPVRSSAGRSPPSREKPNSIQYNLSDIRAPELFFIEIHQSTFINPYFRWTLAQREELGARSTVAQVQFAFFYSGPRGTDFRTFGRFCIDFDDFE